MDAPQIQYAHTEDGVNIAYWTVGQGFPLVLSQLIVNVALEWEIPQLRALYDELGQGRPLIAFDGPGLGIS